MCSSYFASTLVFGENKCCINQLHLIISLLISHYQNDGIIGTLQYSETLRHIIVIYVVILLLRTVTEIVN